MIRVVKQLLIAFAAIASQTRADTIDTLRFGDAQSEKTHQLDDSQSKIISGSHGLNCRVLLPSIPANKEGGRVLFNLKVDPNKQNYFTIKLSGDDRSDIHGRLILTCEGKQVGYRDQGDIDALDIISNDSRFPGRYFYTTVPLPISVTKGKTSVKLQIQVIGRIWVYGNNETNYVHTLENESRGLYSVYTHDDPSFIPTQVDLENISVPTPQVRTSPGEELIPQIKQNVNVFLNGLIESKSPITQYNASILARAYRIDWTVGYNNPTAIRQIISSVDLLAQSYASGKNNPKDPGQVPNDWFGYGPAGYAISILGPSLNPHLDELIDDGIGSKIKRRDAWSKMLLASRDYWRQHRRMYTNQSMIVDLNLYRANLGLQQIAPEIALPEKESRIYLYEAMGIIPWTGNDSVKNYYLFTKKGLSRELGYVGGYGEILDWATQIYQATTLSYQGGDKQIKDQLAKFVQARSYFRFPSMDNEGNRIMRLEQVIGWHDHDYPGIICYSQPTRSEGSAIQLASIFHDGPAASAIVQMIEDDQFFVSVQGMLSDRSSRVQQMLLDIPSDYKAASNLPSNKQELPMTIGQPDFVFSDEEDGVVAIKHGDDILYASLYWRAQFGINRLARIHYITPTIERDATVYTTVEYTPSGQTWTRPDWPYRFFANTPFEPSGKNVSVADSGDKLPIASTPEKIMVNKGQSPYNGRASYYSLKYDHYLIGMNCSENQTYQLVVPNSQSALNLSTGEKLKSGSKLTISPMSTVVIFSE